jgi:hypothetical protein
MMSLMMTISSSFDDRARSRSLDDGEKEDKRRDQVYLER